MLFHVTENASTATATALRYYETCLSNCLLIGELKSLFQVWLPVCGIITILDYLSGSLLETPGIWAAEIHN